MSDILVVDNIHTYYGKSYILQGLSLKVTTGDRCRPDGTEWHGQNHNHAVGHGIYSDPARQDMF
jgi:hypothetical protein